MYQSWRHLDVTISRAVVQTFLCLNCHLRVEIKNFVSVLLEDFRHRIDTLPRAFPGNGEQSRCYLEATCFRNLSWGSLIKASGRSKLAMPLYNMRSLGIAGGVGSTSKSWETKIFGSTSWLRPTGVLKRWYHSKTYVPQKWRAEPCLSGNYSKLSKCMLEKASKCWLFWWLLSGNWWDRISVLELITTKEIRVDLWNNSPQFFYR